MFEKLTVMVAPMNGVGTVHTCINVAQNLKERGHKIVFVVGKEFKGKLLHYGFEEKIIFSKQVSNKTQANNNVKKKPGEDGANKAQQAGLLSNKSALEKFRLIVGLDRFTQQAFDTIEIEPQIKAIVAKHDPDVFILAQNIGSSSFIYSDKPWVNVISPCPLYMFRHENLPSPMIGLSVNSDKSQWTESRELFDDMLTKASLVYNKWLSKNGFLSIPDKKCIPESLYLNLYLYPEDLEYTDIRPIPDNYFRIDAAVRNWEEEFKLPEKLRKSMKSSDKLIYLSLGSMGSIDVELMKRLVRMLSKSEHKFIVSKGLLGDSYELGPNMLGQNSVPKIGVLPLVDLVLTHGANNTVTEILRFGKPMVVMPQMVDQFDNAQRVADKGFGVRLDPYNCTEEELLESIDRLLNDRELKERLSVASHKIQNSNTLTKASELIESLVK